MRRASLIAAIGSLFLIFAASASAKVYCLPGVTDPSCTDFPADIDAAFTAAAANGGADDIRLAAQTYTTGSATGLNDGGAHEIHFIGAGPQTVLTMTNNVNMAQTVVTLGAPGSSLSGLTVRLPAGNNNNSDRGISLYGGSTANRVRIDSLATSNVTGLYIESGASWTNGTIFLPSIIGSQGVSAQGNAAVSNSTITAEVGVDAGGDNTFQRLQINATYLGLNSQVGTATIDDSLINLGTSNGTGLAATNYNNSTSPRAINARHMTIVGGNASSAGALAYAAVATAKQTSDVNLSDSIIAVGGKAIVRQAGNNGAQGGNSVATVTFDHVNYDPAAITDSNTANGSGSIVSAHQTNLAPGFVGAGDFHLTIGSPLVDLGDPSAGGAALDLDGSQRVVDGNNDGIQQRDLGAYETADTTPPETTIGSGPAGPTSNPTPSFSFSSGEQNSTFSCSIDGNAGTPCSGPGETHTTDALNDGPHMFSVTATDVDGVSDPTAATRSFTVKTVAPKLTIDGGPSGLTSDPTPTFTFSVDDVSATTLCSVDGSAPTTCSGPGSSHTPKSLADGAHTFEVSATDETGNTATTSRSFRVDATAPETKITKSPRKGKKPKFSFEGNERDITFECQLNKGKFAPCSSPLKLKHVKPGKHRLSVRAVDAAGNVDATPAKQKFKAVKKARR